MNEEELQQLYASFAKIYADGLPIRRPFELVAAVQAAGQDAETVTDAWLKTLNEDWVYGRAMVPFREPGANQLYRQLIRQR